jgi:hypothetical protein
MKRHTLLIAAVIALAVLLLLPGASLVYESGAGQSCARCHEIRQSYAVWTASSHRTENCESCHGGLMTLDLDFHLGNMRRLVKHAQGDIPQRIGVRLTDIDRLMSRCRECHRQEFAQWQSGPHGATYSRIFLDKTHNVKRRLTDDCLRCHGMFFEGSVRDLVEPVDTTGPWHFKDAAMAARPVMPCLTCHAVHREGTPLKRPAQKPQNPGPRQELHRPSLALFDVRQREHMPAAVLPLPAVLDRGRPVKMSPDRRQTLCYQCHAPLATMEVGSGDDRTPVGVHEGLSCLACHEKHGQQTRHSCANCHPRLSNCGLDVEKMDTTFLNSASKHDIHFVKCQDCHPRGVPPKRVARRSELSARSE